LARLAAGGARPWRTAAAGGNAGDETGAAIGAADVSRSALGKRDRWVRESANRRSDARSHSGIRGGSRFPVPGGGAASAVQSHGRTAPPDSIAASVNLRGGQPARGDAWLRQRVLRGGLRVARRGPRDGAGCGERGRQI